jgi:hypothetical protein
MPRKKKPEAQADIAPTTPQVEAKPDQSSNVATDKTSERSQTQWARSFRSVLTLPAKGIVLGERKGHDWVISFPEDPGTQTKDRLRDAGFEYRDHKWKVFTHAANRPAVEALAKELKRQAGDDIAVNDYPVRQVVLAFDAPPGDDVTAQLRDADFHFRSDFTWNADYSPESQRFARDLIKTLPDQSRSAAAGR